MRSQQCRRLGREQLAELATRTSHLLRRLMDVHSCIRSSTAYWYCAPGSNWIHVHRRILASQAPTWILPHSFSQLDAPSLVSFVALLLVTLFLSCQSEWRAVSQAWPHRCALVVPMQAQVLSEAGPDFIMRLENLRMPKPNRGEVLIKVKASVSHEHAAAEASIFFSLSLSCLFHAMLIPLAFAKVWSVPFRSEGDQRRNDLSITRGDGARD